MTMGNPGTTLTDAAMTASWPTPMAANSMTGAPRNSEGGKNLQTIASWATPAHRDYRHANAESYQTRSDSKKGEQLNNQVVHLTACPAPSPTVSATPSGEPPGC